MLANSELTHIFVFDGAILSFSIPSDVLHISEGGAVLTISASFFLIVATPAGHHRSRVVGVTVRIWFRNQLENTNERGFSEIDLQLHSLVGK